MLKVTLTDSGAETAVTIEGRMDTAAAPEFEQALEPVWAMERPQLLLDCRKLEYISSSGLRIYLKRKNPSTPRAGR